VLVAAGDGVLVGATVGRGVEVGVAVWAKLWRGASKIEEEAISNPNIKVARSKRFIMYLEFSRHNLPLL
jgi:predicted NBD/HSP70 family sugar kinase